MNSTRNIRRPSRTAILPAAVSVGLLSIVALAWWASPPSEEMATRSAPDVLAHNLQSAGRGETAPMDGGPAFLSMRLRQEWNSDLVISNAFSLLSAPATPVRQRRFVEFLGTLNVRQLQALEAALAASQAQGSEWSTETALLWKCWVALCLSSAQMHAATDPQRTQHLGQAISNLNSEHEMAILTQLTKP